MLLKKTRLSSRIIAVFAVIIIINAIGLCYNLASLETISSNIASVYNIRLKSIDFLIEADRDAYQSSIAFSQSFSSTMKSDRNKIDENLASMNENLGQVHERFKKFEDLYLTDGKGKRTEEFDVFDSQYEIVKKESDNIGRFIESGMLEQAEKTYYSTYNDAFAVMRDAMDRLTIKSLENAEIEYTNSQLQRRNIILGSVLSIVLIIMVAVVSGVILRSNILGPVKKLHKAMNEIAGGEGDLTRRIEIDSMDELGELGTSFNRFMESTHDLISKIMESSELLVKAIDEISQGNQNLSQRTTEQAATLEEVASTIEESNATIKQIAFLSQEANDLSKNSATFAQNGGDVMKKAVIAINDINTSSKRIEEIISVIDEIAFQTNLLALNAAVEAARAGEQGRGFAVVAGEVRNLAQRSGTAAKEISDLIKENMDKVKIGTELANKSGELLDKIISSIHSLGKNVSEVTTAIQEQQNGISQINIAVSELDTMTQHNSSLVEETASSSEEMTNQGKALMYMIERFKIVDD